MKTNAPGKYPCEVYLKAWQIGARGDYVMQHIDNCWWCGTLVHGDGEDHPLPVIEEAKRRVAALERSRRRRFLGYAAAGIVGVVALGFGAGAFRGRAPSNPPAVQAQFGDLDQLYKRLGAEGIEDAAHRGDEQQLMLLVDWLAERETRELDHVLVDLVRCDPKKARARAASRIMAMDPRDLGRFKTELEDAAATEADPTIKQMLTIVTDRIHE